jgi:hypothetical protein
MFLPAPGELLTTVRMLDNLGLATWFGGLASRTSRSAARSSGASLPGSAGRVGDRAGDTGGTGEFCSDYLTGAQEEVSETSGGSSRSEPGRKRNQSSNPKALRLAVTWRDGLRRVSW